MQVAIFCHSIITDWNHGNAHFLRGIASELLARGHRVSIFEPRNAWSLANLLQESGSSAIAEFEARFPQLRPVRYELATLDLDQALKGMDIVLVHEWNPPELVARVGEHRAHGAPCRLFFHDTHHRIATAPAEIRRFDLRHYDGVLAFGRLITELARTETDVANAWTWHEAADTRVFHPLRTGPPKGDCVWVGNWGDEERSQELHEYLIAPIEALQLKARVYGVRYPEEAKARLGLAGITYHGWLANYRVPEVFAGFKFTVHVPRRPYALRLPGIPTIRVFEALACGIPLICAPWSDDEHLFTPGRDYLVASDGAEMRRCMRALSCDCDLRQQLAKHGLETVLRRHTCRHRVDELLAIHSRLTERTQ